MTTQLSKTFYCLWIHDILQSVYDPRNKVSVWNGLSIKTVDILATIVAVRVFDKRTEYKLDDGTGVIHCCFFHAKSSCTVPCDVTSTVSLAHVTSLTAAVATCKHSLSDEQLYKQLEQLQLCHYRLPLGCRVHVRGGLQEYCCSKQVVVYRIRVVLDVDEESRRAVIMDKLYREVYLTKV